MKPWSRLRHEWTKNDGKPREEWEPGPDLKETVLVVLLVICTLAMIGVSVMMWVG